MSPADIVQKLCNYFNVMRNDGISYGDYMEQLHNYFLRWQMSGQILHLWLKWRCWLGWLLSRFEGKTYDYRNFM